MTARSDGAQSENKGGFLDQMSSCKPSQFIIHVANEYDYIFDSLHFEAIFVALKQAWHDSNGKNLPFYTVPHNTKYNGLFTTKKDVEDGRQVDMNEKYRDFSQDVYQEIEYIR